MFICRGLKLKCKGRVRPITIIEAAAEEVDHDEDIGNEADPNDEEIENVGADDEQEEANEDEADATDDDEDGDGKFGCYVMEYAKCTCD